MTESLRLDEETLEALSRQVAGRLVLEQGRLIDARELAGRIGLAVSSIYVQMARGELPPGYLIGGARRWNWEEVLKFLRGRSTGRHRRRTRRGRRPGDTGGGVNGHSPVPASP